MLSDSTCKVMFSRDTFRMCAAGAIPYAGTKRLPERVRNLLVQHTRPVCDDPVQSLQVKIRAVPFFPPGTFNQVVRYCEKHR